MNTAKTLCEADEFGTIAPMRRRGGSIRIAGGLLLIAACSFDTTGGGAGDNDLGGTTSPDGESSSTADDPTADSAGPSSDPTADPTADPTSDPTANPTNPTTDPTDPTDPTTDPTDPTDGSTGGDVASIVVTGDDFGVVDLGDTPHRTFTLENVGGVATANLGAQLDGPFDIENDDCPPALEPDETCDIEVSFAATALGPESGALVIDYLDGDGSATTATELNTDTVGRTGNLVTNGGFEDCNNGTPAGWTNENPAGSWECGESFENVVGPTEGDWLLSADGGSNNVDFRIRHTIDVSALTSAIETGAVTLEFSARTRNLSLYDNRYRFQISQRAFDDSELELWDPGYASSGSWTQVTTTLVVDEHTTEVWIELGCRKLGGSTCNAYYDEISVSAAYKAE